jgi:hypothetical protein
LTSLVLVAGCQSSGIEARRKANSAAYAALSPAERVLVDRGQLSKGMNTNAVLIAWGKPNDVDILRTPNGPYLIWNYYMPVPPGLIASKTAPQRAGTAPGPVVYVDAQGRKRAAHFQYVERSAVFFEGRLDSWQINPPPN